MRPQGGASAMLTELGIRNYAVIREVRLELGPGLTVLTGETGAGKSIIVGALSLLLGERASADLVREGEERARVEGAFDIGGRPELARRCAEAGLDTGDGWLILRRELQREGRNRAWVNGSPATAGLIGELGSALVDLHGQHEHQALLRRPVQRRILDAFAGASELARRTRAAQEGLATAREAVATARRRAAELREREEWLRFKVEEIEEVRLEPGEDDRLTAEARRLAHSEDLVLLSSELAEAVYEGEGSAVDRLGVLRRRLAELGRIDPETFELQDLHETALRTVEELGRRLTEYLETVEHDPGRLARIRARLDELYRLKKKYGPELADVIAAGEVARDELAALEGSEREIHEMEERLAGAESRLRTVAGELSERRRAAAGRLEEEVNRLLPELGMEGGRFVVAFEPREAPTATGGEEVEFLVTLNPGFQPASLSRVASGGEMSRVMLALKTALSAVDDIPCLVFDEIDAGVGGEVAHRVAERLARLADSRQVFVVTHLAQIAARARTHLHVDKAVGTGRAAATLRRLEGADRVRELARMLGGDPESALSRDHARELLAGAGS